MFLVAVAISFATSNEAAVTLYLWPFDGMLTAPIWLVVMSSFIVGGALSICLMWAQALAIRTRLWNLQVKFNRLEAEMTSNEGGEESITTSKPMGFHCNYPPQT